MKAPIRKPNVNLAIFWDADLEKLDYTVNARPIVMQVFNYGSNADLREVIECYGYDYVAEVLKESINIESRGFERAVKYLHIPPEKFKCYGRKLFR